MTDEQGQAAAAATAAAAADTAAKPTTGTKPLKVFSRSDIKRYVKVQVSLPHLYPDYDPWTFKMRLKFTKDAEDRRQEYLALSASDQVVKEFDQNLDEVCDLLTELPKGFADLQDDGHGPGSSFRNYVESAPTDARDTLDKIISGAINLYWRKVTPQEFRKSA